MHQKALLSTTTILLILSFFTSCTSVKQLKYFNDLPDSSVVKLKSLPEEERIIQVGDKLAITIGAENNEAANFFNNYGGVPTSGGTLTASGSVMGEVGGYLVDPNGEIGFPKLGKVKITGMTAQKLTDTLTALVTPYLKNPLVSVKFLEFRFTVLGEVRAPGTYSLPSQRTTILDALGAAHDLPRSAKRYDVQIYRDYNGQRTIAKVDLRKKDILSDPNLFELKHNDVIMVQPRNAALFKDEAGLYVSILSLFISVATLIATVVK